jgi:aminopeptidase N
MSWSGVSGAQVRDEMIVLDSAQAEVRFTGIANKPVPSLLRGFSAPVNVDSSLTQEDRLFLARHDSDPFNRWQALQDVGMTLALEALAGRPWSDAAINSLSAAFAETLASDALDDAFKALALSLPAESQIARNLGRDVDPSRIHSVRDELLSAIFQPLAERMLEVYERLANSAPYQPDAQSSGGRALRNRLLGLLVASKAPAADQLAARQCAEAQNMTDRLAALAASAGAWTAQAPALLADFRQRFGADPLVLDKWLAVTASVPQDGVIERIQSVLVEPDFPKTNPNRLRSLVGTFAMGNPTQFARLDGTGFRFVAGFVREVDRINPQVAARVLTGFRIWPMLESQRRETAKNVLLELQNGGGLSRNTGDILMRMLAE